MGTPKPRLRPLPLIDLTKWVDDIVTVPDRGGNTTAVYAGDRNTEDVWSVGDDLPDDSGEDSQSA